MNKFLIGFFIIVFAFITLSVSACNKNKADANDVNSVIEEETNSTLPKTLTTKNEDLIYKVVNGKVIISGVKEGITSLVIPEQIDNYAVTEIEDGAFKNSKISEAVLPKSLTKIGYGIFNGCTALNSLTVPFTGAEHKTEFQKFLYPFGYIFGKEAYSNSTKITQYYHLNSLNEVVSDDYYIPNALKNVTVTGKDNTYLPKEAFYNCTTIDSITLLNDIVKIGEYAFSGVVADITFDNPKLDKIDDYAFSDYKGTHLSIPPTVKSIGQGAYEACVFVTDFNIPDSVNKIDLFAFSYCYELKSVTLGKGVKTLGVSAFYFCQKLKSVALNNGLEEIGTGAFRSCVQISKIEIPSTVKFIREDAFLGCTALNNVTIKNDWRYYNTTSSSRTVTENTLKNTTTAANMIVKTYHDYIWERI